MEAALSALNALPQEIFISFGAACLLALGSLFLFSSKALRLLAVFLIFSCWISAIRTAPETATPALQNLDTLVLWRRGPFVINATLAYSWLVIGVLALLAKAAARALKDTLRVSRFQIALETLVVAIRAQIRDTSGDNPAKYLPLVATFFLFIGAANLLTIIPWFRTPTASLSTTLAFAACVLFLIPLTGIRNAGVRGYLRKYTEPVPLMLPFNLITEFSSVFTMAFRLYGNMLSGAVTATVMLMLAPFLIPLPLQFLGLITGTIQAYIFALLATVYVSAVAPQQPFVDDFAY